MSEYIITDKELGRFEIPSMFTEREIVRCRDCEHYIHNDGCMERCARHDSYFVSSDGFCAWGERKEGDE